jgi:hypothetical protein
LSSRPKISSEGYIRMALQVACQMDSKGMSDTRMQCYLQESCSIVQVRGCCHPSDLRVGASAATAGPHKATCTASCAAWFTDAAGSLIVPVLVAGYRLLSGAGVAAPVLGAAIRLEQEGVGVHRWVHHHHIVWHACTAQATRAHQKQIL